MHGKIQLKRCQSGKNQTLLTVQSIVFSLDHAERLTTIDESAEKFICFYFKQVLAFELKDVSINLELLFDFCTFQFTQNNSFCP